MPEPNHKKAAPSILIGQEAFSSQNYRLIRYAPSTVGEPGCRQSRFNGGGYFLRYTGLLPSMILCIIIMIWLRFSMARAASKPAHPRL